MRAPFPMLAAVLFASPALAAQTPAPPPHALIDPRAIDRVGDMVGAVSHALMNVPIGEVEAAAEGRVVSPSDRQRTVRDIAGPNADRKLDDGIAHGKIAAA